MIRVIHIVSIVFVVAALIVSCEPRVPHESFTVGTALIGTSDAVFDLGAHLAQQYQAIHNTAFVSVYRHDTQSLYDSLLGGRCEEIFIDRALLPAESSAFTQRGMKLYTYPVCYYPVYLLVDTAMHVEAIDSAGLRGVLTGQITSWKQLGGVDDAIVPYSPLPGTGAWNSVMSYFSDLDSVVAFACTTDAKMLEAASIDPGALLIYSHPVEELGRFARLRWTVGELRIPANVKMILEKPSYPFMMLFTYVTTRNKVDVASGYLTFLVENTGQRLAMQQGYRPAAVPVRVVQAKK